MFESPGPDYNLWLNQFETSLRVCDNISENLRGKLEYELTLKKNNSELAKIWELWKHLVINESYIIVLEVTWLNTLITLLSCNKLFIHKRITIQLELLQYTRLMCNAY